MTSVRFVFFRVVCFVLCLYLGPSLYAQETETKDLPPGTIRKSSIMLQRSATKFAEPAYPPLAKAAYVSGAVVVEVIVDEDGNVVSSRAISGDPLLKGPAIAAARKWKFEPASVEGVRVKVIGTITFHFRLSAAERIVAMEAQVRANPDSAEAHLHLGDAYAQDQRLDEALAEFTQAIQIKVDYATAYFGLGFTYERLRRNDEAHAAYIKAVEFNSRIDSASSSNTALRRNEHLFIAQFHYRHERFQEALDVLKQAASIFPDQDDIHIHMCFIYLEIGDKQSAINEYNAIKDKQAEEAGKMLQAIEQKHE